MKRLQRGIVVDLDSAIAALLPLASRVLESWEYKFPGSLYPYSCPVNSAMGRESRCPGIGV
ncbi:hypothetical protein ACFLZ5_00740 [Thermodesulfobacteriota bacterium]